MATAYQARPSDLFGITEQPTAFYLDRAVFLFGRTLQSELDNAGSGKSQRRQAMAKKMVLHRWLDRGDFKDRQ